MQNFLKFIMSIFLIVGVIKPSEMGELERQVGIIMTLDPATAWSLLYPFYQEILRKDTKSYEEEKSCQRVLAFFLLGKLNQFSSPPFFSQLHVDQLTEYKPVSIHDLLAYKPEKF